MIGLCQTEAKRGERVRKEASFISRARPGGYSHHFSSHCGGKNLEDQF